METNYYECIIFLTQGSELDEAWRLLGEGALNTSLHNCNWP